MYGVRSTEYMHIKVSVPVEADVGIKVLTIGRHDI